MRGILFAWSLLALTGCRTGADPAPPRSETPQPITATPPVAITPSTPAPTPTTGTDAPADPPRPQATPPQPPPPQCQRDADCALTRVPDEDCCPRLCAPRAVTVDEERRIEARVQQCQREGRPCALPSCRVPRFEAACVAGTCTTRRADDN